MSEQTMLTREQIIESTDDLRLNSSFIEVRDSILNKAVSEADVEFVRVLLALGANANLQAPWGDSLLHNLAHNFMSQRTLHGEKILLTARALLVAGANPNIIGCNNLMPINVALEQGAREFELLLLEFGAKPKGSPFV